MEHVETNRDKSLRALQLLQLEGLKEIDRICRKHNIKYSLGGGTCLGQLRHGGFIPWDDDIDVDMTMENYKKFLDVVEDEIDHNKFFFRCRKTDKKNYRTSSRLELVDTHMLQKRWENNNLDVGVFVDIFSWSYLPNNKFLRKIVSTNLFYLRCIQNFKQFHNFAKKSSRFSRPFIYLFGTILPSGVVNFFEKLLCNCCGKRKTKWIMDDAIINGNHGGYPSDGIDEYTDVKFEGITVMNKKNADNFMRTIYGPKYMEWLPPVQRLSHHKWTIVDFGPHIEKYDLPENYNEYLSIIYTPTKLKHMQKLSFDMVSYISKVCKKNNLKYFMTNESCLYNEYNISEHGTLWNSPMTIALPRSDYDKLCKELEKNENKMYFLQNKKTDKKFHLNYSRFMINCTYMRDASIPLFIEEKMANGFYINIVALDYAPNNLGKQKSLRRKVKRLNHLLVVKSYQAVHKGKRKHDIRVLRRLFVKIRLLLLKPLSISRINRKLNKQLAKNKNTNYYIDSTGTLLKGKIFNKSIFGSGKEYEYNGYKLMFPSKLTDFNNMYFNDKEINETKHIKYLKENSPVYYRKKYVDSISNELLEKIEHRYKSCHLTYFDLDDYQLSILRYDNNKKKYLSNEELVKNFNFKN